MKTAIRVHMVDDLRAFLGRYREFANEADAWHFTSFTSRFDRFKRNFAKVRQDSWERDGREALDFNVFELLGFERIEADHSRMLAELLDPAGTHGQGPFFLISFVGYCEKMLVDFPRLFKREPTRADFIYVKKEFGSVYGRPDIVVFSSSPPFALIIENKIDAADQEKQLERYWRLLHSQFGSAGERKALIYLSPSGRPPEHSEHIPADVRYYCLSYRTHIAEWLRSCAVDVPNRVCQVLLQYRDVSMKLISVKEMEDRGDGPLED